MTNPELKELYKILDENKELRKENRELKDLIIAMNKSNDELKEVFEQVRVTFSK